MEISDYEIAFCGINCNYCYAHLRTKKTCIGCRKEDTDKNIHCVQCKIAHCAKNNNIDFCFQCGEFPCILIKNIDKRYKKSYSISLLENLRKLDELGMDKFAAEEKIKWTCPQCGGKINLHNKTCQNCGHIAVIKL